MSLNLLSPVYADERRASESSGSERRQRLQQRLEQFASDWKLPGCSAAILNRGQVTTFVSGKADKQKDSPVTPSTAMRIASLSKVITAAATFKLIEEGKLSLSDRVFELMPELLPAGSAQKDKRWHDVTVRHLLDMSAGWKHKRTSDPLFPPVVLKACRLAHHHPAELPDVTAYTFCRRLNYQPGRNYAYSNLSYDLLAALIARRSGTSYKEYVQSKLLSSCGLADGFWEAERLPDQRRADESFYYANKRERRCRGEFDDARHETAPYCRYNFSRDLGSIGWLSTPENLLRLEDAVFRSLLSADSLSQMLERPQNPVWQKSPTYLASSWEITEEGPNKRKLFKDGSLAGTRAFIERGSDGRSWCLITNWRPATKAADQKFVAQVRYLMSKLTDDIARE